MKFCTNCGAEVKEGMKFCSECGQDLAEDSSIRQQEYAGKVIKCPHCGETINALVGTCPSCGKDIRGTRVTEAVREFFNRLDEAPNEEKKILLIRNFPVPNSKEDIFEFLVLASANIEGATSKRILDAWISKFEMSYQKAKIVFTDDPNFQSIQEIYDRTGKIIQKEKRMKGLQSAGKALTKTGGLLKYVLFAVARNLGVIAAIVLYAMAIRIDRVGGNNSVHELVGVVVMIVSACILAKRNAPYIDFIVVGFGGVLSIYMERFLKNGSLLEVGGGVVLTAVAVNFFRKSSMMRGKDDEII